MKKSLLFTFIILSFTLPSLEASVITEVESNDTFATAQNINPYFSLDFSPNIGDKTTNTSTIIPHVTIEGSGDGTYDVYSFFTSGGLAIFDIDVFGLNFSGGLVDSELSLFDVDGNLLDFNDDDLASYGQLGSDDFNVEGDFNSPDSYLEIIQLAAGKYFIQVGSFGNNPAELGNYSLQVSLENPLPVNSVAEPNLLTLMGLGLILFTTFCYRKFI